MCNCKIEQQQFENDPSHMDNLLEVDADLYLDKIKRIISVSINGWSGGYIEKGFKINYCPICGEKLN